MVLSDRVYIYIHSGDRDFAHTAIDIPFHLISDICVEPTPLDQSIGVEPPADLILQIQDTGGNQAYVNSSPSELSIVQLTFRDTAQATDIAKAVQHCKAKLDSETGGQDAAGDNKRVSGHRDYSESAKQASFIRVSQSDEGLVLDGNYTGTNPKSTKQTGFIKVSQSDEGLVLDGNYTDTNAIPAEAPVNSDIHAMEHAIESSFHESFDDSFVGVVMTSKSNTVIARDKTLPAKKNQNTTDDDGVLYDASPIAHGRRLRSSIAAAPANNSLGLLERVLPIPTTASSTEEQREVGRVGKITKSLHKAPTNVNTRSEGDEVSGMTINTSDEFGISSPHIHQSPSVILPGNPADDALPPTQHEESIDELAQMPPVTVRPKRKQALKSKKPLGLSKKADENGNTAQRSTQQQNKVSERKYPLARGDVVEETQDTGNVDIALEKVLKDNSDKVERRWSIEADSPKLPVLPLKQPVGIGKGASKKRKSELDPPDCARRGTRRDALPVKQMENEFDDDTLGKSDVRPGPSNRANKPLSTKLAKTEQADGKEDSVIAAAVVTKPKRGQKKPLLRPKAALKVKESVPDDMDMSHADTGDQHVESDMLDPLQQHENFFEEAFHDYDLPNMDGEPSFTPVPSLSAVTKMASKMADMFGFGGESAEPKRKARVYGKPAQKAIRAPPKQPKPKTKVSLKGKEKEEVDVLPEVDSLPEQPEQKKSPVTTGKLPASTLGKDVEIIYISSDEESDDPGDVELHQPQAIAQATMIKLDEKSMSATAVKTESSSPALLEAPSELSPEDQSTPAMTHLSHSTVPPAVDRPKLQNSVDTAMIKLDKKTTSATASKTENSIQTLLEEPSELSPEDQSTLVTTHLPHPTARALIGPPKPRNAVDAVHLVDDHLARKTPIVAFGRNGPKNQGVYSALKPKPTEHKGSKADMAKLVNVVALGSPRKRPSPEQPSPHFEAPPPKRIKKVEVATNTAVEDGACNDDIPNMPPHRMKLNSPFAPQQDSLLCSSQSRVDENGSPHARPMIIEESANVAQNRRRTLSIPKKMPHISQNKTITANKGPFDDPDDDMRPDFDDEPTIVQQFGDPSPNRKPQPLGREREANVNPHYLVSRPTTAGKNVEVIPETDHASTVNSVDPFAERQPRQLSNFAKRLKGEQPARSKVTITTEAQPQPLLKAASRQPRKRSFVFEPEVTVADPDKTLVDTENQNPWRRARSISLGSSVSSSDIADDKASVAASEEAQLTPEMAWRKTLQPPYRNLTDTLICMVYVSRNPPPI